MTEQPPQQQLTRIERFLAVFLKESNPALVQAMGKLLLGLLLHTGIHKPEPTEMTQQTMMKALTEGYVREFGKHRNIKGIVFDFPCLTEQYRVEVEEGNGRGLMLVWSKQVTWAKKIVARGGDSPSLPEAYVILYMHQAFERQNLYLD